MQSIYQQVVTDPKFQVEGVAPTNDSSFQKTRLNGVSYGLKIWTDLSSIFSQSTRLTDRQTEFSSLDRICIPCSAVKTNEKAVVNRQ